MEDGIKKLTKAHQKTEKLQERQAASLDLLVKLQTQAYAASLSRHPRSLATSAICPTLLLVGFLLQTTAVQGLGASS